MNSGREWSYEEGGGDGGGRGGGGGGGGGGVPVATNRSCVVCTLECLGEYVADPRQMMKFIDPAGSRKRGIHHRALKTSQSIQSWWITAVIPSSSAPRRSTLWLPI